MSEREHELDADCWCEPEIEEEYDDDGNCIGRILIHRETH